MCKLKRVITSASNHTKYDRPKGFIGRPGLYYVVQRNGVFVGKEPGGGRQISEANCNWIRETFELEKVNHNTTMFGTATTYLIKNRESSN